MNHSLLVLWDIDGTLLVSDRNGTEPYDRAIHALHPDAQVELIPTHGMTDCQATALYLKAANLELTEIPLVLEQLDIQSAEYLTDKARIAPLAGVDEALARVASRGFTNGLLTGNTPARAINKLTGSGMDTGLICWEQSFFGATAALRSDVTQRARIRFPDRPIVIIGDTPLDGQAAVGAGIEFIGVTTGAYGAEALREAGAPSVVDDLVTGLDEIDEVLQRFASRGTEFE